MHGDLMKPVGSGCHARGRSPAAAGNVVSAGG